MSRIGWVVTACIAAMPAYVLADEPTQVASASPVSGRDWHVGLNLRTDFGARFYRADVGVRLRCVDMILVLDPFGFQNHDYDIDGLVRFSFTSLWSVFGGGRVTIVPIGRDQQYSEKILVGLSGLMPSIGVPRTRLHAGVELAIHTVSHGGGLMTQYVCVDSPICRKDHFVFGFFGRLEYASPF